MALLVSKDCFPATDKCHNCMRKGSDKVKKVTDPKEDSKRCSGCHLLTYCDRDCQKEHWKKIHKNHCRFLAGKTPVKNSKHDPATCVRCIEEIQASLTQQQDENSPKTNCNIEQVMMAMKMVLSQGMGFHQGDGKSCHCLLKVACQLPFPLIEVTGGYLEGDSTGLDAPMAHSLKIVNAMLMKTTGEDLEDLLSHLYTKIIVARCELWFDIIVSGMPTVRFNKHLSDQVDSLRTVFGASNPWWKTLKFSVNLTAKTTRNLFDSRSLEEPRFQKIKQLYNYTVSQLQNRAAVTEKKFWASFLLWPELVNGSLAVLLPPGTRCQNCYDELSGEVEISPHEVNSGRLPCLFSDVGDNGALMASCPVAKNPSCKENCQSKDVEGRMRSDQVIWKQVLKDLELFCSECRECGFCLKWSRSSHRCSACLAVQYCSTVCQKEDLEFHKTVCAS